MNNVVIVDYGVGNLKSVHRGVEYVGGNAEISSDPDVILKADRLIMPGVGAFRDGMAGLLRQRGMIEAIHEFVETGNQLLGICLGMQLLFDGSDEFGEHEGLGLISGNVVEIPRLNKSGIPSRKIPHIGWGTLTVPEFIDDWSGTYLESVSHGEYLYFVHSYMAVPKSEKNILAYCDYGGASIVAAVKNENVMGVQFHPEKSGEIGLRVLSQFIMS